MKTKFIIPLAQILVAGFPEVTLCPPAAVGKTNFRASVKDADHFLIFPLDGFTITGVVGSKVAGAAVVEETLHLTLEYPSKRYHDHVELEQIIGDDENCPTVTALPTFKETVKREAITFGQVPTLTPPAPVEKPAETPANVIPLETQTPVEASTEPNVEEPAPVSAPAEASPSAEEIAQKQREHYLAGLRKFAAKLSHKQLVAAKKKAEKEGDVDAVTIFEETLKSK